MKRMKVELEAVTVGPKHIILGLSFRMCTMPKYFKLASGERRHEKKYDNLDVPGDDIDNNYNSPECARLLP